jgi:hypothetical protein
MSQVATISARIPAMSQAALASVYELEGEILKLPQVEMTTHHVIHGGMYARTITVPAGVVATGALIKIATILVVNGHARVTVGDDCIEIAGHHVIPASAGRKQGIFALADTVVTMIFATDAQTVGECEIEFTDEADRLASHHCDNIVVITGE